MRASNGGEVRADITRVTIGWRYFENGFAIYFADFVRGMSTFKVCI